MLVWAHRGASAYAPENTLEAFQMAIDMGADGIELDVHICKTGEVVVCHDETVDRTSNGTGRICDMTFSQLRALSFHNGRNAYLGVQIPTLEEVYRLIAPTRLTVDVELKTDHIWYEGLEERCLAIAREYGIADRVLYSSFNHKSLAKLRSLDANAYIGLLYGQLIPDVTDDAAYAASLQANAVHPAYRHCNRPGYLASMAQKGIHVNPWTVDDEEELYALCEMGINAVITNTPDVALRVDGRGIE